MLIDLIIIAIIVISAIVGYSRGFIRSLLGFAGTIIAILCAIYLSPYIGRTLDDMFVRDACTGVIENNIRDAFEEDDKKGEELFKVIDKFVFSDDISAHDYAQQIENDQSSVSSVSAALGAKISDGLSSALAFILVFILTGLIVRILTIFLDKIFKLPVLKQANKLFGLIFGLILALVYLMILSRLFIAVLPWLSSTIGKPFTTDLASSSVLLRFFSRFNLFKEIIKGAAEVIV